MTPSSLIPRTSVGRAILLAIVASGSIGYGVARWTAPAPTTVVGSANGDRKILYYFDPMVPQEHYDSPDALS